VAGTMTRNRWPIRETLLRHFV